MSVVEVLMRFEFGMQFPIGRTFTQEKRYKIYGTRLIIGSATPSKFRAPLTLCLKRSQFVILCMLYCEHKHN